MRTLLGVPIFSKGELIGALYLADKQDGSNFTEPDQQFVEMLALHAAIAIENARLYEQTQRLAILEERERFARDLHDSIIQSIYGVGLTLDQIKVDIASTSETASEQIDLTLQSLASVIQDLRNYIFDLRPQALKYHGLKARLEGLIRELRVSTLLAIQAEISPDIDIYLSDMQARHIFHICHEALANAARHAKASQISLSLAREEEAVMLRIEDDGIGFEMGPQIKPGHRGLVNMYTRASEIGTSLTIDSVPQQGTRLTLILRTGTPPSDRLKDFRLPTD
jgi:signal transduction histidine kinase